VRHREAATTYENTGTSGSAIPGNEPARTDEDGNKRDHDERYQEPVLREPVSSGPVRC